MTDLLDAPHYVEVAYEPTPEVKQNEMLDDSKPENNWQNFLVDPVETSPDSSLGVFKIYEKYFSIATESFWYIFARTCLLEV